MSTTIHGAYYYLFELRATSNYQNEVRQARGLLAQDLKGVKIFLEFCVLHDSAIRKCIVKLIWNIDCFIDC